ncbi:hypothetical protein G3435_21645 [Pseudomonas sp. MAFF212428]|uniref:Uncharacterized protein n=1 Tax=Pseudomonas brassicae TaxID=2708063 RepID=A0A6B3NXB2_9PSED|nr:hypothetical protein [Pseudomonas brassicae]NER61859.1 hypothetical protein [Pseudomonas brassicae]NER66686.1 hypothetical protein [Pseudomonas brassicae]
MAFPSTFVRALSNLAALGSAMIPHRLSRDEAHLIEHYRTLSEQDRIAVRFLCSAIKENARF